MGLFSSIFGSKKTTKETSQTDPWEPAIPYLTKGLENAQGVYDRYKDLSKDQTDYLNWGKTYSAERLGSGIYGQMNDAARNLIAGNYTPELGTPQGVTAINADPTAARAAQGAVDPTMALSKSLSGQVDNPQLAAMAAAATRGMQRSYGDAVEDSTRALTEDILPQIRSGAISSGGYGGSRQGIAEGKALAARETQLGRNARDLGIASGDAAANLYGQAYESAQNRMASTADSLDSRAQQVGMFNAGQNLDAQKFNAQLELQKNDQAMDRARLQTGQMESGAGMFGQQGDMQQADTDELLKYAGYPATWEMGLLSPYISNVTGIGGMGQQGEGKSRTTSTPSLFKVGSQIAAMAMSDGRLKTDVETVGYDARGRRWVDFKYVWEPEVTHRGVIAQEVMKTDPDAVMMHPSGFLMVDYGKLED